MRFSRVFFLGLLLAGCSTSARVDHVIEDQQFVGYKKNLDQLEHDYLHKRISYAQYLEQKQKIEESYQEKIDTRRDVIENKDDIKTSM